MEKKDTRKLSGCIIILFGFGFISSSIGVIITIVFGGSLQKYFTDEYGDSNLWGYKAMFWILLIAVVIFLAAGGKFSKLSLNKIYDDDEDKKDDIY